MPHHVNFDTLENQLSDVDIMDIDVIGWKKPLQIEYVYVKDHVNKLFWRVKGTTHTFTIELEQLNKISQGDYVLHFQQALTVFRDDLIKWAAEGLTEKWMREYLYMYKNYIIL